MADKTFEVDIEGKTYEVDAPDEKTAWAWANQTHAQAKKAKSSGTKNIVGGAISGAADIGTTLLTPIDWVARKLGAQNVPILQDVIGFEPEERRRLVEKTMVEMGADPESFGYQAAKVGTQIAGTAGAPGAIARPAQVLTAGRFIPGMQGVTQGAVQSIEGLGKYVPEGVKTVGRAIESGGFNVPQAGNRVANAALRVGGGAAAGGAAAGLVNPEDVGTGAMGGGLFGALTKPIGAGIESAVNLGRRMLPAQQNAVANADQIQTIADQLGIDIKSVTPKMANFISAEVDKATRAGRNLDVAALARSADFQELGMKPLLGQITRDPTQFAQERNLRGAGTGIQERLTEQNRALQNVFSRGAEGAVEPYQAGNKFIDTLRKQDEAARGQIDALYKAARESDGRYADIDHVSFIKKANDKLDEQMLGRFLPENARNLLNDIAQGKVPLNVNNLVQVDSVLSAAQRSADDAGAKAIGVIRTELNDAPIASTVGEKAKQAFDVARSEARKRFAYIESNPALKAILDGKAVPDDFVNQFIIKGKANNVNTLAEALRNTNPDAFAQAKSQMAADIQRAAFGENITADAAIRPEMLARKLREIGTEKMSAFFSPEEISRYNTAMRVANYIEKHPNAAPVNTSNTLVSMLMQSPLVSGLERIPVIGGTIGLAKAGAGAIQKQAATSRAMNANVPSEAIGLTDAQRKLLAKALGSSSAAVGVLGQ